MKPSLYTSAVKGDVAELEHHKHVLDKELTPNQNTVLHVVAQFGQVRYAKEILKACPFSLLILQNVKGETPIHIAAREGRAKIVEALIACAKRLEEEIESGLVGAVKEMLRATNVDGDTALHMAVRNCHLEEVKFLEVVKLLTKGLDSGNDGALLQYIIMESKVNREQGEEIMRMIKVDIEEVKEMMRATEVDRDTVLHMVARSRFEKENRDTYLKVVKLLSEQDAEFQYSLNNFQETPLYLAAERGIMGVAIVEKLVETYKSLLAYCGPGDRTALHAAALMDSTGQSTKKLLEWKKDLINQADAYGWKPLHYASCIKNNANAVKQLLAIDQSVDITTTNKDNQDTATSSGKENEVRELLATGSSLAYITTTNKEDKDTALHIAAAHGHVRAIKEFLSYYPDCWEMVNSKGQNVLHIAVDMNRKSVVKYILRESWVRQLINQKDKDGNTPLHLLISSDCNVDELWKHQRADHLAFNHKNMTPVDLVWSNFIEERLSTFAATYIVADTFLDSGISGGRNIACNAHYNLTKLERARTQEKAKRKKTRDAEKQKEEAQQLNEAKDCLDQFGAIMIVASLIATITFTAAFAIPGGYDGNQGRDQGIVVLARAAAFKAFLITNTIAMVSSVTSIFLSITGLLYNDLDGEKKCELMRNRSVAALRLLLVSMFTMMVAFIAAMFAVLAHSIALAVSICVIACTLFIVYFLELAKVYVRS